MTDKFANFAVTPTQPATAAGSIVPNDGADLADVTLGLNVAAPGTVRVTMLDGSVQTLFVREGIVFPLRARRVWATGTTATGISGLY